MSAIRWSAFLMPLGLIAVVAYVTYAIVVTLCMNLLISPPAPDGDPEERSGAIILSIYMVFVLLMATSWFRLLYHAIFDPGFVGNLPEGKANPDGVWQRGSWWETPRLVRPPPSLESFYDQEFFVCDAKGKPLWCEQCQIWKPDRTHHSKQFGYCIHKIDHYCPWVGGLVGIRNFKFFIQFCTYAALFSLLSLAICAYFLNRGTVYRDPLVAHLSVTVGLGVFFVCLAGGTGLTGWLLAFNNLTTLDNIYQKKKIWGVAVRAKLYDQPEQSTLKSVTAPQDPNRTFVILESRTGGNPFDAGLMENVKQVMGRHWWDWILPIRHSPICYSDIPQPEVTQPLSPVVEELKEAAGLGSMDPAIRSAYDRIRKRQERFPHLLAGAGAPIKTIKARNAEPKPPA